MRNKSVASICRIASARDKTQEGSVVMRVETIVSVAGQ